jgi:hypothetical protein
LRVLRNRPPHCLPRNPILSLDFRYRYTIICYANNLPTYVRTYIFASTSIAINST